MGNVETKDLIPNNDQTRRELDLRLSDLNHERYTQHINGEYSENCLKELPWHIRDSISLYEKLNVSFNCLSSLPMELPFRIPHLAHLDISYNQITSLPESIGLLFHLEELLARNNKMDCVPASITQLTKLKKIDFSANILEFLPNDIGYMKSLVKLNVSENNLKCLPASLGRCPTLKIILALKNPSIEEPPLPVCEGGSYMTLSYLKKNSSSVPNGCTNLDCDLNTFARVRGNQVLSSVPNPHSARAQYVQLQTETLNTISRIKTPLLPPYKATTLGPYELRDKIIGLIYGAVIGDAIGLCTELLTAEECQFNYDEDNLRYDKMILDSHRLHWKAGDWTSTGDQMFVVLDSLLNWGGVVDELDFAKRLLLWKQSGIAELGDTEGHLLSGTASLVLQDPDYESSPHSAAKRFLSQCHNLENQEPNKLNATEYADNGALTRAVILGIPHFHDIQEVVSDSIRICMATHAAGPCWAAGALISALIALMLQGNHDLNNANSLESLLEEGRKACIQQVKDRNLEEEINRCFSHKNYKSINLTEPGKTSYAFKPLAAALVAIRSQTSFRVAISSLVMQGGHSTVNGAIAGALMGCKEGFSQLPSNWVSEILEPQRRWINDKINSLLDIMGLP